MNFYKKIIVVSGINMTDTGKLSILNDCLECLSIHYSSDYEIVALIPNISLANFKNVKYKFYPISKKSWLFRLYYEYVYFYFLSKNLNPYLWLSLHDITPNAVAFKKAVYCHNPSPFYTVPLDHVFYDFKFTLFSYFYKYLYSINLKKNNFVVVQQHWLKRAFEKIYKINTVIVSYPVRAVNNAEHFENMVDNQQVFKFVYPSAPRIFKNFEIICEATHILGGKQLNFEVYLTIDGSENAYTRDIYKKYSSLPNIKFIGLQTRDQVTNLYAESNCLIFPSKLETWGLPISEYKNFGKPMIVADLPYARETVGNYSMSCFFNPNDAFQLSQLMEMSILRASSFSDHTNDKAFTPHAENWEELFKILI